MNRRALLLGCWLTVPAFPLLAGGVDDLSMPPQFLPADDAARMSRQKQTMWVTCPKGDGGPADAKPGLIGFVRINVPDLWAGAYLWDEAANGFREIGASRGTFLRPFSYTATPSWMPADQQAFAALIQQEHDRVVAHAARATAPAAAVLASALQPPTAAREPEPVPVTQPTEVRRNTFETVAHRTRGSGWILAILGVALGCVLGAHARRTPREIVIQADEHDRAVAALRTRLSADARHLQTLSAAVDLEEARFVQRVAAITERR